MLIKKGIILKINKNNVVVLTHEGEFLQLKKHDFIPILGEEYESSVYYKRTYIKPLALAACLLLIINFGIIYRTYFQVYDTIDVSINPSIRLYINRKNNILMTEAINEDGEILLSNIHTIKGENCEKGILDIIDGAIKLKYLNSQNSKVNIHSKKDKTINYTTINKVLKKLDDSPSPSENSSQNSQHKFNKNDVTVENIKKSPTVNKDHPQSNVKQDKPSTNNQKNDHKVNENNQHEDYEKKRYKDVYKNEDKGNYEHSNKPSINKK